MQIASDGIEKRKKKAFEKCTQCNNFSCFVRIISYYRRDMAADWYSLQITWLIKKIILAREYCKVREYQ